MSPSIRSIFRVVLAVALSLSIACGQSRDERRTSVGMRARIDQLVLPGTRLIAKPAEDPKAKILLRILETWPHGTEFRYDLEYVGFLAGKHDLRDWLVRADGTPVDDLPKIEVMVDSVISPLRIEPNELQPTPPPDVGGYRPLVIAAIVAWSIGLLAILFVRRRRARSEGTVAIPATLADRLRPMVEDAMHGRLDERRRGELERLLFAHWRQRLELRDVRSAAAIATLRAHPEAGVLLRQLEDWLHRPGSAREVDVQALLAPYRDVRDPGPEAGA